MPIRIRFAILAVLLGAACLVVGCKPRVEPTPAAVPSPPEPPKEIRNGWGTLTGTFRYQGEIPPRLRFNVAKDPLCQMPVEDESFIVDEATRGLANVLIYARKTADVHPDFARQPGREVTLTMNHCRREPRLIASTLKDKFVLVNIDRSVHNVAGAPLGGNSLINEMLPPTVGRFPIRAHAATPEPYHLTCAIHPWESAYHIVRPDPYFAVTAKDGTFKIERLPTGVTLEFQVWHERAAGENHGLRAKPEWKQDGRFELKISKDGDTATLDVEVEAKQFEF